MTALAPIAPKLGKLVRLLASDRDGEALAAARMIGRTLAGANLSFHDLAAVVEREPERANSVHLEPVDIPQTVRWPSGV